MGRWSSERLAALSGVAFVVLFIVGFSIGGESPGIDESNDAWVAYFLDKHTEGLIASAVLGLAVIAFIWFVSTIATRIRRAGEDRLAAVAFGGGMVSAAAFIATIGLWTALAYRIALDVPDEVKGLVIVAQTMDTFSNYAGAAAFFAVAIAAWRSGVFPRWWAALSGAAAVIVGFGGGALMNDGFYSPDGAYYWIVIITYMVWSLGMSALLFASAKEEAPRAATATA